MTRILVTGMSGVGKSTVLAELAARGHHVIDTDYSGWSEEVALADGSGHEQLWREDRMRALLADDVPEALYVAGCTANQAKFYDRFDAVVLLSAPVDVLFQRIGSRTTNQFGKDPTELARITQDLETVEPLLRNSCTAEIDTARPLTDVVEALETIARFSVSHP